MLSNEEHIDIMANRRERSGSATSIISISSETPREPRKYSSMDLKTLIKAVEGIDISAFDRTRLFNPRKQRSCHKRAEPMSEEHRKRESSKNSREYTKRNRDEISTCRALYNDLIAVKNRLKELLKDFSLPSVEGQVQQAVADVESILRKYFTGPNLKNEFGLPELNIFLNEYREKVQQTMLFEHRPSSPNQHKEKLAELRDQYDKLTNDKYSLNSSKDKTNFASSKSRLNQRIVRENLKSMCWDCWKDINTMTVQGEELQQHCDSLKLQVWEKIMSVYCHIYGRFKQKVSFDVIKVEKVVAFFAPFSHHPGRLFLTWKPNEKKIPEIITIHSDDDETVNATTKPQPSTSLAVDVKVDDTPPVERPSCMDMTKVLNPLIQDRVVTTTQLTPPALSSPSFTLSLPTVPATVISVLPVEKPEPFLIPKIEVTTPESIAPSVEPTVTKVELKIEDTLDASFKEAAENGKWSFRKKSKSPNNNSNNVTKVKQASIPHVGMWNVPMINSETDLSGFPTSVPFSIGPTLTTMTNTLSHQPLPYNPLLAAAPGEITPFEALTPSFLRLIEQQRLMGAFLNNAFQKCQKP